MLLSAAKFERATSATLTPGPTVSMSKRSDPGGAVPQYTGKLATTSGPYAPSARISTWYDPRPRSHVTSAVNSFFATFARSVVHLPSGAMTSIDGWLRRPSSRPCSRSLPFAGQRLASGST